LERLSGSVRWEYVNGVSGWMCSGVVLGTVLG
jgi:hypothetical protein